MGSGASNRYPAGGGGPPGYYNRLQLQQPMIPGPRDGEWPIRTTSCPGGIPQGYMLTRRNTDAMGYGMGFGMQQPYGRQMVPTGSTWVPPGAVPGLLDAGRHASVGPEMPCSSHGQENGNAPAEQRPNIRATGDDARSTRDALKQSMRKNRERKQRAGHHGKLSSSADSSRSTGRTSCGSPVEERRHRRRRSRKHSSPHPRTGVAVGEVAVPMHRRASASTLPPSDRITDEEYSRNRRHSGHHRHEVRGEKREGQQNGFHRYSSWDSKGNNGEVKPTEHSHQRHHHRRPRDDPAPGHSRDERGAVSDSAPPRSNGPRDHGGQRRHRHRKNAATTAPTETAAANGTHASGHTVIGVPDIILSQPVPLSAPIIRSAAPTELPGAHLLAVRGVFSQPTPAPGVPPPHNSDVMNENVPHRSHRHHDRSRHRSKKPHSRPSSPPRSVSSSDLQKEDRRHGRHRRHRQGGRGHTRSYSGSSQGSCKDASAQHVPKPAEGVADGKARHNLEANRSSIMDLLQSVQRMTPGVTPSFTPPSFPVHAPGILPGDASRDGRFGPTDSGGWQGLNHLDSTTRRHSGSSRTLNVSAGGVDSHNHGAFPQPDSARAASNRSKQKQSLLGLFGRPKKVPVKSPRQGSAHGSRNVANADSQSSSPMDRKERREHEHGGVARASSRRRERASMDSTHDSSSYSYSYSDSISEKCHPHSQNERASRVNHKPTKKTSFRGAGKKNNLQPGDGGGHSTLGHNTIRSKMTGGILGLFGKKEKPAPQDRHPPSGRYPSRDGKENKGSGNQRNALNSRNHDVSHRSSRRNRSSRHNVSSSWSGHSHDRNTTSAKRRSEVNRI